MRDVRDARERLSSEAKRRHVGQVVERPEFGRCESLAEQREVGLLQSTNNATRDEPRRDVKGKGQLLCALKSKMKEKGEGGNATRMPQPSSWI